jgi:hypothetical protein
MRSITPIIAIAALAIGSPALAGPKGDALVGRALKNYTAGTPVSCIPQRNIRSTEIIDRTAIIYTMNNGDKYLNRPDSGADQLDSFSLMVTDTHTPELCDVDTVKLKDRSSRLPRGLANLGKFVPVAKKKAARG